MVQSSCSGSVQWAFGTIRSRSPWQNAYVERLIGSIRRECLDHMIVFGEAHLRLILRGYAAYYIMCRGPIDL
ncbi:integrase core domain-containing protein [Bradyrhizobium sp. AZCC 2289]|uniref:integrase core domain-containing protein n=1 Tax=Bradyrhizobium sp. AZCC 2289 TaxID=3117026 RepID=UPI003FA5A570